MASKSRADCHLQRELSLRLQEERLEEVRRRYSCRKVALSIRCQSSSLSNVSYHHKVRMMVTFYRPQIAVIPYPPFYTIPYHTIQRRAVSLHRAMSNKNSPTRVAFSSSKLWAVPLTCVANRDTSCTNHHARVYILERHAKRIAIERCPRRIKSGDETLGPMVSGGECGIICLYVRKW